MAACEAKNDVMKSAGVIVEFNPLHNGHMEHLHETKRLTGREHIIAVMSGNFVQRGEPAICDKWRRTRMALLSGVDIVIELPVGYVVAGADYFARGSVGLLAAAGVVDRLCFGSESGDLEMIKEAGRILSYEPEEYKTVLRDSLGKGMSFAAARGAALNALLKDVPDGLLTKPNNGLGIEYCKALWQLGWPMEVFTSYRAPGGPSATAIRKGIINGCIDSYLPAHVSAILKEAVEANEIARLDDFSDIFRYLLYTQDVDMGEGLENRFRRFSQNHSNLTELMDAVKTKRYTYTRLQRAVLGLILGIQPADIKAWDNAGGPRYIRVLGFRRDAAALLGEMTRKASLPVITHGGSMDKLEEPAASMLAKEFEVGDIYRLALGSKDRYRHERGIPIVVV